MLLDLGLAMGTIVTGDIFGTARTFAPRVWLLLAAAIGCMIAAIFASDPQIRMMTVMAGMTLAALVLVIRGLIWLRDWQTSRVERRLVRLVGTDAAPCFTTDDVGRICYQNQAAKGRFSAIDEPTLLAALGDFFASPASVLFRLQSRARTAGSAREDVVTRRGHLRLSVQTVGPARFLWRLEEFADRSGSGRGAESLSLPMLVANRAGVVLFTNEAMRRLLGQRPKRLDRIFSGDAIRSGDEVRVASAEGPVRAILAEIEGVGDRREIYLLPVPDRVETNQMLTDFESVPVALMKFRPDGSMRAANRAARELTGLDAAEDHRIGDIFAGLGRSLHDWVSDIATDRVPGGTEVLQLRGAKEEIFLQVNLRHTSEDGRSGVLAVLQDATAMRTLEAQFVQSQKMQAIGQLAGGVAHDFNNLLTAISGHCDLLLLRHTPTDPEFADLMQIHQNANRAASLVGQLLAFSRKQTLRLERVDLHECLSDLTHLLNRLVGEKVKLRFDHGDDVDPVRADKRQLEQVMMNLVVNARDAMPDGGVIRIETQTVVLADDLRRDRAVVPAGIYSVIRVADVGVGIPPDKLQKIFEPFFTTKGVGEGTGLGLSTVYGIVKQSAGFVFVDSEVGRGSIFHVYFPISLMEDDPVPAPKAQTARRTRPGEGVVLLVEDEAPVRAFASRALRLRGFTVVEAENAEEALKALEDPALDVDVFVTDVVMPGMDGPTWVRQALKDRPNVRVIFVSGYSEDCVVESQGEIPNSVFLPKPFSLNELAVTVQGQMH